MAYKGILTITILLFVSTCGSVDNKELLINRKPIIDKEQIKNNNREKAILNNTDTDISIYDTYLVKIKQYTTNGVHYHKKYHKHLIGIARIIMNEKRLSIAKNSIGFYFDTKESAKNRLYLGLDINIPHRSNFDNTPYSKIAIALLKENITNILHTIHSCRSIFTEKEIVGMVIGLLWKTKGSEELLSIWIDKRDVLRYEENKLTLNELILRNPITNNEGKIIRLPI